MITINTPKYRTEKYEGYWTSPEILYAIETVTGQELPEAEAQDAWESPSEEVFAKVLAIAFSLTTEDELQWGISEVARPE